MRRCGLRVGELRDLTIDCVSEDLNGHWFLKIPLGKLNNERIFPLDPDTVEIVEKIKRHHSLRPEPGTNNKYLISNPHSDGSFPSKKMARFSACTLPWLHFAIVAMARYVSPAFLSLQQRSEKNSTDELTRPMNKRKRPFLVGSQKSKWNSLIVIKAFSRTAPA